MTALHDLATGIQENAARVRTTRTQEHVDARIRSVTTDLMTLLQRLQPIVQFVTECADQGLMERPPVPSQVISRLRELATLTERDPEGVVDADDLAQLRGKISAVTASWETQGATAWSEYCRRHVPTRQETVLQVLEDINGPTAATERLAHLDRVLDQLVSRPPIASTGGPALLVKTIAERRVVWSSLQADEIPPSVLKFITAAASQGAELSLLTPEVREWLAERDLEHDYVVVCRSRRD